MTTPTLHCFAQSGNAYKAALMLELCGAPWQPVFVDFFNGEARGPEYREINEMGEVPTYTEGDLRLTQSGVILDYLAEKHGRFGPADAAERREILRWLLWDNHKLTGYIATARFMKLYLPEKHRKPDVIDFLMGRATNALKILDHRLADRDFILGPKPKIADLSCAGYIWFLEDIDIAPPANVAAWRARLEALAGWKHPYDLMPGHPLPGAG